MPKLVKPKDIDLQNEKACNDLKDRMRMVFMRLTVTNEVKKPEMIKKYGETFTYTEEYIKKFLKRYDCIEYFYIYTQTTKTNLETLNSRIITFVCDTPRSHLLALRR